MGYGLQSHEFLDDEAGKKTAVENTYSLVYILFDFISLYIVFVLIENKSNKIRYNNNLLDSTYQN